MTVLTVVRDAIQAAGLDGLCSAAGECACLLDDLAPCGEIGADCELGHKVDGCSDDCGAGGGCDFHVVAGSRP